MFFLHLTPNAHYYEEKIGSPGVLILKFIFKNLSFLCKALDGIDGSSETGRKQQKQKVPH